MLVQIVIKKLKLTLDKFGKLWYNYNSERKVIIMAIIMNKVANKSKRALKFEDLNRGDIFRGSINGIGTLKFMILMMIVAILREMLLS